MEYFVGSTESPKPEAADEERVAHEAKMQNQRDLVEVTDKLLQAITKGVRTTASIALAHKVEQ